VVIDGTLIPGDRLAADRPFYSGKHRRHGMNLQVIASPDGQGPWVSGALTGSVHDLTAARIWGTLRQLAAAGLVVLADKGVRGERIFDWLDQHIPPEGARRRLTGQAHLPGASAIQ
jgi:hypothetical protein